MHKDTELITIAGRPCHRHRHSHRRSTVHHSRAHLGLVRLAAYPALLRAKLLLLRTSERTSERAPRAILYATLAALTREAPGPVPNGR